MIVTKFISCRCLHHLCNAAELLHIHIMRQNMSASDHSLSMSQCQTAEVATKTHDEVSLQEAPFWMQSEHMYCHSSQNPECMYTKLGTCTNVVSFYNMMGNTTLTIVTN